MGTQLLRNEKVVQEHQLQQLVSSQLREADQIILSYFSELESALLKTPPFARNVNTSKFLTNNADAIRNHILKSPYIENIFILSANGQLLFPNKLNASRKEQEFITQNGSLWSTMDAFHPETPADINSEKQRRTNAEKNDDSSFSVSGALSKLSRGQKSEDLYAEQKSAVANSASLQPPLAEKKRKKVNTGHGWTVWRTGTETHIFFWFWDSNNQLTGLKLANAFWLAELINQLPDDRNAVDFIGDARIQLINEKQTVMYQWGQFEESLIENIQPKGQRLLGHPLDGWRLAYFAPNSNDDSPQWLLYLMFILIISAVLASLGFYMFREYRRDMRTAEQRVTFVNQVSHELKTPLTNICLYAELIEAEVDDNDGVGVKNHENSKIHKYSKVLTTESQRLGRLINNVLSFSQSQKKEQRIEPQEGSIDNTILAAVEMFNPAFEVKNIQIDMDLKASKPAMFDHNALEQIINNLLGNIEKYASHGKYARIESTQTDNTTQIRIQDHGPGIDKKLSKRLFEPFFRGNSKLTEGVSGTGIGLSIAKELCQLHGGDLIVEQNIKKGASFLITINTPQAASQATSQITPQK